MKRITATFAIATSLLSANPAWSQVTLETLGVVPPDPIITDDIVVSIGGTVNESDFPMFRSEWQRDANDILVDVLLDYIPTDAPPRIVPYTERTLIGPLPAGTYDLTTRLFALARIGPEPPFPDPWTFPETFDGLVGTLETRFTVAPEPASIWLAIAAAAVLSARRKRNRNSV
jgi:hypothetical protein